MHLRPRRIGILILYASDTQLIREGDTVALFTWVVIFLKYMLGKRSIKWMRQRPDVTIAVDWDVKHHFKETKPFRVPRAPLYAFGRNCT